MKARIRGLMRSVEMSQADFGNKLEIAPASLSNIFTGKTNPTNNHVMAIHRAFPEVNINWLLFGEGDMYCVESENKTSSVADLSTPNFEEPIGSNQIATSSPVFSRGNSQEEQMVKPVQPILKGKRESMTPRTIANQYLLNENIIDKPVRKAKEIRVYFDDGTYESFIPSTK